MSDQPTSLFTSGSDSGYGTPGSGLGGATTQPLERAKRRELNWNRGTDFGLVLLRFVGGQVAMLVRSLAVHINKRLNRPKPIVFDRTPKKGA